MKILFYNWDPLCGPAGGGVGAYITEMISCFLKNYPETDIWFLNSGRKYDDCKSTYIQQYESNFGDKVHTYEVVNSPILAAGRQSIKNFELYVEDESLVGMLKDFIEKNGSFNVIHFHNIEGLSYRCLELKKFFPATKFVLTLHNYFPFCPQVNLWRHNKENCPHDDYNLCNDCFVSENYELANFRFRHLGIQGLKDVFLRYSAVNPDKGNTAVYGDFIGKNISSINQYFDYVLCVSKSTMEIAKNAGIAGEKLRLSYAGSKVAERCNTAKKKQAGNADNLHIVYLGYACKEKGFDFFIDSFSDMPDKMLMKLSVTIVSRLDPVRMEEIRNRLSSIQLAEVRLFNGYKDKDQLCDILADQDLGIVPVLWEDNLPRVAMEQFASGIPLLTSDLGGAKELGNNNERFVFKAGDAGDYISKLDYILSNRQLLEDYFKNAMHLITMKEHVCELMRYYEE